MQNSFMAAWILSHCVDLVTACSACFTTCDYYFENPEQEITIMNNSDYNEQWMVVRNFAQILN